MRWGRAWSGGRGDSEEDVEAVRKGRRDTSRRDLVFVFVFELCSSRSLAVVSCFLLFPFIALYASCSFALHLGCGTRRVARWLATKEGDAFGDLQSESPLSSVGDRRESERK